MTFCTIISINYTKFALSLFSSIQKTNSEFDFYIFCIDNPNEHLDFLCNERKINLIYLSEINWSRYKNASIYFTSFEFINSLKPFFIEYLLFQKKHKKVIYLDSDILVKSNFEKVNLILDKYDFCFTPHQNYILPLDNQISSDLTLLQYGFYNGGFYAFNNSENSKNILNWLQDCMINFGFKDLKNGMYYDQKILPLAANIFHEKFYPLHDDGHNVAYWNIHERNLYINDGKYFSNDSELVFFHFSHFNFNDPKSLCKWKTRHINFLENKNLQSLISEYIESIKLNTILEFENMKYEYPFSTYENKKLNPFKRNYFFKYQHLNKPEWYFLLQNFKFMVFKKLSNYMFKNLNP